MTQKEFLACKQNALKRFFQRMNAQQFDAVTTVKGSVLVLAGAGSGKTTVIVNRIANMILFGDACHVMTPVPNDAEQKLLNAYAQGEINLPVSELQRLLSIDPINPWNILAITFTNKAANELKERLASRLGDAAQQIHASTFHAACVRILRTCIHLAGYDPSFVIYDTDDCMSIMKTCMRECNIDEKQFQIRDVMSTISHAKDKMIAPDQYLKTFGEDYKQRIYERLYRSYQEKLKNANAVDFDDLIFLTVQIFQQHPDVLEKYQDKYQYIMVDEYQDTNHAQYQLVNLLAEKYKNLCVVGDDDQSIYSFRGAVVENILSFNHAYADCKVIRLEQNYRSTQNILNAANSVIAKNTMRKSKTLWSSAGDGELVSAIKHANESAESQFIADMIQKGVQNGKHYSDFAVLYRMNALSNAVEKTLIRNQIPYRIYGGTRFQDRKEIKDVTAYLCVLQNPFDFVHLERIINLPARGIGEATTAAILQIAQEENQSLLEVIQNCQNYPALSKKSKALFAFSAMMQELSAKLQQLSLENFFDFMLDQTGYLQMLEDSKEENAADRIQNVKEYRSNIIAYLQTTESPSLEGFLAEMSLYTDADKNQPDADVVSLMSMHSAKGLEFDTVFAVGMEEKIFPGYRSSTGSALEEERRLAYVTITRAKQKLYLLYVYERLLYGYQQKNTYSRFINEIHQSYIQFDDHTVRRTNAKTIRTGARDQITAMKKTLPSQGNPLPILHSGDRIRSKAFGDGTIIKAEAMGNDYLLEIAFDTVGIKKLMARYAKIIKL